MSAFTLMAHALRRELLARELANVEVAECEEILRCVIDRAGAAASRRLDDLGSPAEGAPKPN